jgi:Ca2+-binding RTX toxin-like protein
MKLNEFSTAQEYIDARFDAILCLEQGGKPILTPYNDGKGFVSIGIGINLQIESNRDAIYSSIYGLSMSAGLKRDLDAYLKQSVGGETNINIVSTINAITQWYGVGAFKFSGVDQVKGFFNGVSPKAGFVERYEKLVDGWTKRREVFPEYSYKIPNSKERLVLLSLAYGGSDLLGGKLASAIKENNRAKAWFEIRYNSNAIGVEHINGDAFTGTHAVDFSRGIDRGAATRRYYESSLFGLYVNPGDPTEKEALDVVDMLTKNRLEIFKYENVYGTSRIGRPGARLDACAAAVQNYANIAYLVNVSTTFDDFKVAQEWVKSKIFQQYPDLGLVLESNYFDPLDTYYSMKGGRLDSVAFESAEYKGVDNNDIMYGTVGVDYFFGNAGSDLIVGNGGDDFFEGGAGDDTMVGGGGYDTYIIDLRDGVQHDKIVDVQGVNKIIIKGLNGEAMLTTIMQKVESVANVWANQDKSVTITHNSPWQMLLSDGSVVELGDATSVSAANLTSIFGITLSDAPVSPVITTLESDVSKGVSGSSYLVNAFGYSGVGISINAPDVINGSTAAERISGLGGNDGLSGGDGADIVDGGEGDDLILGGFGADTLNGGAGNDFIFGSATGAIDSPTSTTFTPPVANGIELARGFSWVAYDPPVIDANGRNLYLIAGVTDLLPRGESDGNFIDGGTGDDKIYAGSGSDIVHGGDGNDSIDGMGKSDVLYGDLGNDAINGDGWSLFYGKYTPTTEHGNDVISGGAGMDQLVGQGGNDELFGGTENDKLFGDDTNVTDTPLNLHGDDYLDGGDGADYLDGGGKNDVLYGGIGDDSLFGDGFDSVVAIAYHGNDYLNGEDGNDQLTGGGGDDELFGGTGNDVMWGDDIQSRVPISAHGSDYMDGEAGNDTMSGSGGADTLLGGDGNDYLVGDAPTNLVDASVHGADYLDGGTGNDSLEGNGGADTLMGGTGSDTLFGHADDDYLDGGADADYLAGGAGNDTYVVAANETRTLTTGAATLTLADTIDDVEGKDILELTGVDLNVLQVTQMTSSSGLELAWATGQSVLIKQGLNSSITTLFVSGQEISFDELVGQKLANSVLASATATNTVLRGGKATDNFSTIYANARISGGQGNDKINISTGGGATLSMAIGDGCDALTYVKRTVPTTGSPAPINILELGNGTSSDQLTLYRIGTNAFVLTFDDQGDGIRFSAGTAGMLPSAIPLSDWPIDQINFSNGTSMTCLRF